MIDADDPKLSVSRQCGLLNLNRSTYYYKNKPVKPEDLELMRLIDEQYLKTPAGAAAQCEITFAAWAIKSTANGFSGLCD